MKIAVDLDGTLCTWHPGRYEDAEALPNSIDKVREMARRGHEIWIYTGRGSGLGDAEKAQARWEEITRRQLADWGVDYERLIFGKPPFDVLIDDRALRFDDDWGSQLEAREATALSPEAK